MTDTHISLAHGNGGRLMRELIEGLIADSLGDRLLDIENDAARIDLDQRDAELLITTDGFTVKPLEFPGGDIGSLAVHGTVNDLAVSGATPHYLSLNLFIEEGLEVSLLQRLLCSLAKAAGEAGVKIACGDTKVVPRGEGSGVYFATTGVGLRPKSLQLGFSHIQPDDRILVSGPIGDHGIAVMLAREQFGLRGDVRSDAASVLAFTRTASEFSGLRYMRDPTRGGLATVLHELHRATGLGVRVYEPQLPIRDQVKTVCEMLGYDPHYLACEGRVVAIIAADQADSLLQRWQQLPNGGRAALIGQLNRHDTGVVLETELGGERVLEELEDDPLPRIC
ncbi:hydrogenase expression/formation protein HypE [Thiohalophilus thiocyanatoxydans]|uniref:hydrogenase expression/formation protein HypE n=1 Tax=Thiohalophilus thiocyanatoxydans TaxID=381308 RepID=UPI0010652774|nr:hydrogenase expression/formation protein HypE [Thiohalophilus thiocyanatoxydans]